MPIFANILGPDMLVLAGIVVLLFGGSQLPKFARGLGEAKSEFEKAQNSATRQTPEEGEVPTQP